MSIVVIWNGQASTAADLSAETVQRDLAEATGGSVTIEQITEDHDIGACVKAAITAGAKTIVAAGGDGTVSAVAALISDSDQVQLGVLPLGTSNSFAAALGIPAEIGGAIEVIARADCRPIDLAYVTTTEGRKAMVLHCMIGFHADAIANTATDSKRRWGVLAYAGSAMRELANLESFAVEIDTGEHIVKCSANAVAAANLAPIKTVLAHGPSHVLGDDGLIDVTIVAADSMLEAIATGVHLYRQARSGEPATRANVGSFSARTLVITTDPPQQVLVDGEAFGTTPVTIENIPHALRVLAPSPPPVEGPPAEASLIGLPDLEVQ
ncbi:MAG: YegS/Rv2252/BmrU family lipid kinase [Deltaproteobacteria bacterium]|nr:YegS/Rv2252/BmrU family lipid kinase [Deltaproteobacteria bacterium]